MFHEELKKLPIADIQQAISKAIYELGGGIYHCDIRELEFKDLTHVSLGISVSEHNEFFPNSKPPFPMSAEEAE